MNYILSALSIVCYLNSTWSQSTFYNQDQIQEIKIYFNQTDWDYELDTAKAGSDSYILASSVEINGTVFSNVGVKYKGNSSYDATNTKNPLHIELNNVIEQSYQGFTDIKLSTNYGDPSAIREVLAYSILSNYMVCPKANFANVYINDTLIGLYSNVESINKDFYERNFYSDNNAAFKCNPTVTPGPTTKSSLRYLTADSVDYENFYELKSTTGWDDLIALADAVTNNTAAFSDLIDIDRAVWMLAFNNVLVNLDSYSGVFCQNYYLYQDNLGRFNPIVWDVNMSFGAFPFVGSGNSSMGTLTIANMQQLPVSIHSTDQYWPLIKSIYANPTYKKMYFAHLKTILDEFFVSGEYLVKANALQSLIQSAVIADTNSDFTDLEFTNSMNSNTPFLSYSVPGIETLMNARTSYLQASSELTQTQPTISNIVTSVANPAIGQAVVFNVNATNATEVYIGLRASVFEHFERFQLFDDGLHSDGAAGDNVYGISQTMNSALVQYYIYAQNGSIGKFSPERAEFEFHVLTSNLNLVDPGDIALNEILASNQNGDYNEYFNQNDWIELYNREATNKDLFGLYITDDRDVPNKFAIPNGISIGANNHAIIWMDNDFSSAQYAHAGFSLSSLGETIYLYNSLGELIDSVSYGIQTPDISLGRCPDGTGPWAFYTLPTFNAQNCLAHTSEQFLADATIYPNPFSQLLTIESNDGTALNQIQIHNLNGQIVYSQTESTAKTTLHLGQLAPGIYHVSLNGTVFKKIVKI